MRLIDVDEIKLPQGFFEKVDNVPKFYEWLGALPTVDAEPIRHGHWTDDCRCSECGAEAITEWNETGGAWVMTPFCPFCGAEMEMEEQT